MKGNFDDLHAFTLNAFKIATSRQCSHVVLSIRYFLSGDFGIEIWKFNCIQTRSESIFKIEFESDSPLIGTWRLFYTMDQSFFH